MAKRSKAGKFYAVSFRVPLEHYTLASRVAVARGVDVSAVLNHLISDGAPGLVAWLARYEEAMGKVGGPLWSVGELEATEGSGEPNTEEEDVV